MYLIPTYIRREDTMLKGASFAHKGKVLLEHPAFIRDKLDKINLTPDMAIIPMVENWTDLNNFISSCIPL